jgi:hypothetical protein
MIGWLLILALLIGFEMIQAAETYHSHRVPAGCQVCPPPCTPVPHCDPADGYGP